MGDKSLNAIASNGHVKHNRFEELDIGFDGNNNPQLEIVGNHYKNVGVLSQNIHPSSRVGPNLHMDGIGTAVLPLGTNAAAPSVGNVYADFYYTVNSTPTMITNFLNGYNGQLFQLLINDTNTTIQPNAGLLLRGGINASPPIGAIFQFYRDSTAAGAWWEFSRSY